MTGIAGLISDSHGNNRLLKEAISALSEMGAQTIWHLGDFCDSVRPEQVDESVGILKDHNIMAVMGNNEISILMEDHTEKIGIKSISFLRNLPFTRSFNGICLAHSIPFDYPSATRRPISEYMPILVKQKNPSFHILFRGHSHTPLIQRVNHTGTKKIPLVTGNNIKLDRNGIYVITIGALEDGACCIFDPDTRTLRSFYLK
ncbi:MAG: metallophosphoesterase family protein [Thermodesulfobacteriota bacterium]|nr:metallophosphoesterase family protein [Thermodesulfobacteriota bacterium]